MKDPHVAGTLENFTTTDYILSKFQKYGLDVHCTDYQVVLSYPLSRNLSLRLSEGKIIQLKLKEKEIGTDSFTKRFFRGDIVQNDVSFGAVGVEVYSDPQGYGGNRTKGYYPKSRWLPRSGVQRGSVFQGVDDPLTSDAIIV
eukprot:Gb_36559 [translate_table: standard]